MGALELTSHGLQWHFHSKCILKSQHLKKNLVSFKAAFHLAGLMFLYVLSALLGFTELLLLWISGCVASHILYIGKAEYSVKILNK